MKKQCDAYKGKIFGQGFRCKKEAKWFLKSMVGDMYLCSVHVKKFRDNVFAIIERLPNPNPKSHQHN